MNDSIEKLRKFFRLEAERGYDNRAVMGGLANMLGSWEAAARLEDLPEDIIQAVGARLRDYGRLTPESREEALKGLWNRIRRQVGEEEMVAEAPTPPTTPQPKPEPEVKAEVAEEPPQEEEKPTPPPQPGRPSRPRPEGPPAALDAPTTVLNGVGPKNAEHLARMGLNSLGDMLYHFPRRYDDYSKLKTINRLYYGEEVTVIGAVQSSNVRTVRGGKLKLVEVILSDGTAALRVNWFNQPWLTNTFKEGTQVVLSGKIDQYLGRLQMTNPEWELVEQENLHTNRIVPVYPLTGGITQRQLRGLMNKVVSYWALRVEDYLPAEVRQAAHLMELPEALFQIHFPDSWDQLRAAQHRLAFDEIFLLQLGVLRQKRQWTDRLARSFLAPPDWLEAQTASLPFELTGAQQRALEQVVADLASGRPMNRLLQGDVGSGKTVIAALAAAIVTRNGPQAAILAPTSILADQHYRSFQSLLAGETGPLTPEQIRLMIGDTPDSEKEEIRGGLADGTIKVIVGTHALLEDPVEFNDLQLAVIDEQHRFGVEQRAALRAKGNNPHLMVMTATPIPRSLALTSFGFDYSELGEMPPGRLPVDTHVLFPTERERAYTLIKSQLEAGHQAFIVYPLVEESEKSDTPAAVEEHERLQREVFPNYKLGLLHGRLKPDEKDAVMSGFRDGEYHVLVSTSVVEVGMDIPNATVMLIEGANRFGLAQLHQFRGRVRRGGEKSYCLLIPETKDAAENERLSAMAETNDGFALAERDLDQRGPGELLGTLQAAPLLRFTSITDKNFLKMVHQHAKNFIAQHPELDQPEYHLLAATLHKFWGDSEGEIS